MQTLKNNNNLIVSIPRDVKNKIDAEFGKEYSSAGLEKIYFIYFKINKENNNYQVNSTNHTWFFGFKNRGELGQILKRLVNNVFALKISDHYSVGYKSNSYSLIKPYDYKNENCHRINYYDGQVKFPMWVQKYVADGGIVKSSETTNWEKNSKKSVKSESQKDIEIKQLRTEIERLQGLLANVDPAIQTMNTTPLKASNEVVFQPVKNNKFSKNKDVILMNHDETPDMIESETYSYKYGSDIYLVIGWQIILEVMDKEKLTIEEVQDDIYYLSDSKTESIYGRISIYKNYDFNDMRYNVQISA